MATPTSDPGLSNPFSTGSGGATFEQLVGASYLVSLLAGHLPRGLDWGITREVLFQQRWSGCVIDDVVVVSSDGTRDRRLALQLKHDLSFTKSDETFARVIADCWLVFTNAMGWRFNPDTDRIGIGLGVYQTKLDAHFRPLLEWARTEQTAAAFFQKIATSRFSSAEKREYVALLRELLAEHTGSDVTDDELWRFLKCLIVLHFDLENAGSRDATHSWNALLDLLEVRSDAQARVLFDALCAVVAKHNRTAGSLNLGMVRAELPSDLRLKDQPQYGNDLGRLRRHSQATLAAISNTIGLQVQLPRSQTTDEVMTRIREKDVVVITGEPMVGKSGLLKLLAGRIQLEGEVFAFGVEEFGSAATLVAFLHTNHITHDFSELLAATGDATHRCILIDGLERATTESKRRVINDLLIAVRQYNERLTAHGGAPEYRWRIVFTARSQEAQNVLVHLNTRQSLQEETLAFVTVGALTDDELAEVVAQLPKLKDIAASGHLKDILSRPLVLDILTLPDITLPAEQLPARMTETWLLDWFWSQVVRRADEARPGRGHPDMREELLIQQAMQVLGRPSPAGDGDAEALTGLLSDRLLLRVDGALRFGHDALEDWSLAVILRSHLSKLGPYLLESGEPLRASRAFQLATVRALEVQHDIPAWLRTLRELDQTPGLSPRWYQLALSALLSSDLIANLLPRLQEDLFAEDNALLCRVLRTLRMIEVQPSPSVYALGDLPEDELEKYLAYWNMPVWRRWMPVIRFVLAHRQELTSKGVLEFSYVARKWLENTEGNQLFRRELAAYAIALLRPLMMRRSWSERDEADLSYEEEGHLRENLSHSVLRAADCLPDEVEAFIREFGLRTEDRDQYDLEDIILREGFGWVPLCRHLPDLAVEVIEGIICNKIEPDHFGSYDYLFMELGISSLRRDNPPTPDKGPFRAFLRFHEEQGLTLIHRVVNHATRIWVMREQMEWGRHPVPQVLSLPGGDAEVWGHAQVYQWFRYPSNGPDPVTCALMALEAWMHEQVEAGADPKTLFERVLRPTNSVAIVGVCMSVALAHIEKSLEAVVPFIERPAFWEMDIARFTQDMTAASSTQMFSEYFSLGNDKSDYQTLLATARQPQRSREMRHFVLAFLMQSPPDVCERVQAAIRAFPENPPLYYEEERERDDIRQARIVTMRLWAALAERENYEVEALEDRSAIAIQFKLPEPLAEERREENEYFAAYNEFLGFQTWCMAFLKEGRVGERYTFETALMYAQELVLQDDPSVQPESLHAEAENRANAIAMFAAALVLHAWDWIAEYNHVSWCRAQLLVATRRHELPTDRWDEHQRWEMGYRRSAARALPILLGRRPQDNEVRDAVLALAVHRNEEVRAYLFLALSTLWETNSGLVWECIDRIVMHGRMQAIRNRYWMLQDNPHYIMQWGRFPRLQKLRLRTSLFIQLLLVGFRAKPIQESTYKDISVDPLQSTLYAIPNNAQIVPWASDRTIAFLAQLVSYTVNNFVHFQDEDKTYNKWSHDDWNKLLFPRIANALLRLPLAQGNELLKPILARWEEAPSMMEELLRSLSLTGAQAELEERLIEVWIPLADTVLDSDLLTSRRRSIRRELHEILGLVIFSDPTGIITWKVTRWEPLQHVTELIDRWVARVGQDRDCFPSLVRLLRGIGFYLMPEFGVTWLYRCLSPVTDLPQFFKYSQIASTLAELLHDSWKQQSQNITTQAERYRQFVYLVDRVAGQGEQVAVRLQKQLQGL